MFGLKLRKDSLEDAPTYRAAPTQFGRWRLQYKRLAFSIHGPHYYYYADMPGTYETKEEVEADIKHLSQ